MANLARFSRQWRLDRETKRVPASPSSFAIRRLSVRNGARQHRRSAPHHLARGRTVGHSAQSPAAHQPIQSRREATREGSNKERILSLHTERQQLSSLNRYAV